MSLYQKFTFTLAGIILTLVSVSQPYETDDDYTGDWDDAVSWVSAQPSSGTITEKANFNIYGYITEPGNMTFASVGTNSNVITIHDTLVVGGNLTFNSNSISLDIADGGLLVVFGNYSAANKVDIDNGGTMVVKGDVTFSGGGANAADYTGGGALYVSPTSNVTGDADASAAAGDYNNLEDSPNAGEDDLFDFIEQSSPSVPLPVELLTFNAGISESGILVVWETATEINNDHFTLERSYDGKNFEAVTTVAGNGNSSELNFYKYNDVPPAYGQLYYRLTQYDFDGQFEIFPLISVLFEKPESERLLLYPNTVTTEVTQVHIKNQWGNIVQNDLRLIDMKGQSSESIDIEFDSDNIRLNLTGDYRPGLHILKGTINGVPVSEKIIFTR